MRHLKILSSCSFIVSTLGLAFLLASFVAIPPAAAKTTSRPTTLEGGEPPLSSPRAPLQEAQAQPAAPSQTPAPTPAAPTPGPAAPTAPAPTPSPAPSGGDAANATLGPPPADPGTPDELTVAPKAEAFIEGEGSWDEALKTIREAQKKVKDALGVAGVKVAGRPLTRFVKTSDDRFNYEVGYPIEASSSKPALPPEIKLGTTPSGAAVRFTHHGAYDDIDGTYEAITIDLDAKGIAVNDAFLEEYVNDVTDPADANLEIYIYVFKK
jgi:effector-binding domain-containing protein